MVSLSVDRTPSPERAGRIIRSAVSEFDGEFAADIVQRLPASTIAALEALLQVPSKDENAIALDDGIRSPERSPIVFLKSNPGHASLDNLLTEIAKLELVRNLKIPTDLFEQASSHQLKAYRQRTAVEELHELRRHPRHVRITLLAAFCSIRCQEITDSLVDLLIHVIHRISIRAERRVEREPAV